MTGARRPLIVHVVHRFAVGGMENGVVNLVNGLPEDLADHCVIALTDVDPEFAKRIVRPGVRVIALHRRPGPLLLFVPRLVREFRSLRPDVVHTRNVGTLEAQLAAWAARVPVRIHGEHGWDVGDLAGENPRMLRLRRRMRRFVHHWVALSAHTHRYLVERVGVPAADVTDLCNGVDTERFSPAADRAAARAALVARDPSAAAALGPETFVVGAIGRIAAVKNLPMLVDAFARVRDRNPAFARRARLAIVGDGPDRGHVTALVAAAGLADAAWMPGERADVPDCLRALDLLCLPSLAEGISNTILEAMACGVPVVATDVGGNRELVEDGVTGALVPSGDAAVLADRIDAHFADEDGLRRAGAAARARAVTEFSLPTMIGKYHRLYRSQLERIR